MCGWVRAREKAEGGGADQGSASGAAHAHATAIMALAAGLMFSTMATSG